MADQPLLTWEGGDEDLGPAMAALTEGQKGFVLAMLDTGGANLSLCYRSAYQDAKDEVGIRVNAHRLAHSEKIQAAILEEGRRRLNTGGILAVNTVLKLCNSANENVRLRAAQTVMDRVPGLSAMTMHKVEVARPESEKQLIREVFELSKQLGLDPRQLLGQQGIAIDAEFEEITALGISSADDPDEWVGEAPND